MVASRTTRRHGARRSEPRGFAMLIVIIVVALLALVGMSLLRVIGSDLAVVAQSKHIAEAQGTGESAVDEVRNDSTVYDAASSGNRLPRIEDMSMSVAYTPPTSSPFNQPSGTGERSYAATIALLRLGPAAESSSDLSRSVMYEVSANAVYKDNAADNQTVTTMFRTVSKPRGWQPPRRYYR